MTYEVKIYYQNDSYIPKALNFLGSKFNKNLGIKTKIDNMIIPIGDEDIIKVGVTKGLNKDNILSELDYAVIQDSLIKTETLNNWCDLKEKIKKDFWVVSERSLEE